MQWYFNSNVDSDSIIEYLPCARYNIKRSTKIIPIKSSSQHYVLEWIFILIPILKKKILKVTEVSAQDYLANQWWIRDINPR